MTQNPQIPVSIGEIFDKYSILEIKQSKITDPDKLRHITTEMTYLRPYILEYNLENSIYQKLKTINLKLWDIEDKLRIKEYNQDFDAEFIELARNVYFTNDSRGDVKKEINVIFHSNIHEVKSYVDYKQNADSEKQSILSEYAKITLLKEKDNYNACVEKAMILLKKVHSSSLLHDEKRELLNILYENLGFYYFMIKDFNKAIEGYTSSIKYSNSKVSNLSNIGVCYGYLNDFDKAIEIFESLLREHPTCYNTYNKIGFIFLRQRKIKSGLHYLNQYCHYNTTFHNMKKWDGLTPFNTIVVNTEGLGDMIQFGRYVIELSNKYPNATIYFLVDSKLENLIDFNNTQIICANVIQPDEQCDYYINIYSLMHYLNIDTITPYTGKSYIIENPDIETKWSNVLKNNCTKKLKVCICWKGLLGIVEKYIPLENFKAISSLDIDIISLQRYSGSEEIEDCGFDIMKYDIDKEAAFVDTIAIIRNSDLVISVDTSILHLSAVMGINTWLVLGSVCDWRWFDNSKTTEWYNNVKIFKSETIGNWNGVFHDIHRELQRMIEVK